MLYCPTVKPFTGQYIQYMNTQSMGLKHVYKRTTGTIWTQIQNHSMLTYSIKSHLA